MIGRVFYRILAGIIFLSVAVSGSHVFGSGPFDNSSYVSIDGQLIHFRVWSSADGSYRGSALFLHGFAGSTYSWEGVADSLQQLGFMVVAIDIPPFGFSDKSPRINQSLTARAETIHGFLETVFPQEKWYLTGHSMGGSIAQALALMYPETFTGVCFVAPTLFINISAHDDFDPTFGSGEDVRRNNILSAWPIRNIAGRFAEELFITGRRVGRLLESAYGQPPDRLQIEGYLMPLLIPGTAAAILASGRRNRETATLHAADLSIPAIAVWGDNDTWVPLQSRKEALGKMPGIAVYIIEGAGHNPMETHLEAFMDVWLKKE